MSTFSKSKISTNIPFGVLPKLKEATGGLPIGGATGQKLVKKTDEDFQAEWVIRDGAGLLCRRKRGASKFSTGLRDFFAGRRGGNCGFGR